MGAFLGFSLTQAHIPSFSLLGPGLLSGRKILSSRAAPLWSYHLFGLGPLCHSQRNQLLSSAFLSFFLSPRVSWGCFCEQMTIPGLKLLLLHTLALSFPLEGVCRALVELWGALPFGGHWERPGCLCAEFLPRPHLRPIQHLCHTYHVSWGSPGENGWLLIFLKSGCVMACLPTDTFLE